MSDNRNKDTLFQLENVCLLQQYLYMSEDHSITVVNAVGVKLRITIDDELHVWCQNLTLANVPPMKYDEEMTVLQWYILIDKLKTTPAEEFPQRFKNRLDEILTITRENLALNQR